MYYIDNNDVEYTGIPKERYTEFWDSESNQEYLL